MNNPHHMAGLHTKQKEKSTTTSRPATTSYKYYFFELEMSLKSKADREIYANINISHIPTQKLIEIFKIDTNKDPLLLNGYVLTKAMFAKHKKYILENIGFINLDMFQYALLQSVSNDDRQIRQYYKESLME